MHCCTYKLIIISFLNFSLVSNGVADALQLLILNIFKISWAYFFWCRNTHSLMYLNSISKKYEKFPMSGISNFYISFDFTPFISASSVSVISKSSTYKHIMTQVSLLALLTYTSWPEFGHLASFSIVQVHA